MPRDVAFSKAVSLPEFAPVHRPEPRHAEARNADARTGSVRETETSPRERSFSALVDAGPNRAPAASQRSVNQAGARRLQPGQLAKTDDAARAQPGGSAVAKGPAEGGEWEHAKPTDARKPAEAGRGDDAPRPESAGSTAASPEKPAEPVNSAVDSAPDDEAKPQGGEKQSASSDKSGQDDPSSDPQDGQGAAADQATPADVATKVLIEAPAAPLPGAAPADPAAGAASSASPGVGASPSAAPAQAGDPGVLASAAAGSPLPGSGTAANAGAAAADGAAPPTSVPTISTGGAREEAVPAVKAGSGEADSTGAALATRNSAADAEPGSRKIDPARHDDGAGALAQKLAKGETGDGAPDKAGKGDEVGGAVKRNLAPNLHPVRNVAFADLLDGFAGSQAIHRPADILAGLDRAPQAQNHHRASEAQRPTPLQMLPIEIGMHAVRGISSFQIRLDPAELGRVDVTLKIHDNGQVNASLVVDRVETLQLLKRDASTLEFAFEQAGLKQSPDGLSFSLRGEGQQGQNQRDAPGGQPAPSTDEAPLQARIGDAMTRRVLIPHSSIDRMV